MKIKLPDVLAALLTVSLAANASVVYRALDPSRKAVLPDNRRDLFATLRLSPADTVFIGDSLVALGEWGELTGLRIHNRGIGGIKIGQLTKELGTLVVGTPGRIIIEVGINDMMAGTSPEQVAAAYVDLIGAIEARYACPITVVPIFTPNEATFERVVRRKFLKAIRPSKESVSEANRLLAQRLCGRVAFAPVGELLAGGEISENLTIDGLHLNGRGMQVLARSIK